MASVGVKPASSKRAEPAFRPISGREQGMRSTVVLRRARGANGLQYLRAAEVHPHLSQDGEMAERVVGEIELWDGWRLVLPNDCMSERNQDGSWSAWDSTHTVDVHIVTVTSTQDGRPLGSATTLGRESNVDGAGWIGHVEQLNEADAQGPAYRLAIKAGAENSCLSCWVAYRNPEERTWGDQILESIVFNAPEARKRRFGRR